MLSVSSEMRDGGYEIRGLHDDGPARLTFTLELDRERALSEAQHWHVERQPMICELSARGPGEDRLRRRDGGHSPRRRSRSGPGRLRNDRPLTSLT